MLDALYEDAVRDTIERFEATGSPVVTDGEQRKYHNFWTYCVHGLPNMAPDGFRIPFAAGHTRRMPRLTAGPFRYKRFAHSYLEVALRHAKGPVKQAVISPSALSLLYPAQEIAGYTREQFIDDLLREHETEVRSCLRLGAHKVQIDFTEGRLAVKLDPSGELLKSFIHLNNLALSRFSTEERQRIGVHTFGHSKVGVFTERAERLVVGIAAQASVAIDNARLFDETKRVALERERLIEAERAARSEMARVSRLKDEFLATLSHELRTPLTAVLGWARVLLRKQDDTATLERGLEAIERNAVAQARLIDDLLDMNRIISGKVRLDVQPTDLSGVIDMAVDAVRPSAEGKDIRLRVVADPTAGPVSGDPHRLQQVIWNLLTNAVKFTPRGGRPAGEEIILERGGYHVMFMGLTMPFEDGAMIPVTLVFAVAGAVAVEVPVTLSRLHDSMEMGQMSIGDIELDGMEMDRE